MRKPMHPQLRELLRGEFADGALVKELAARVGASPTNVRQALENMPDAYVDRWTDYTVRGQYQQIWCVVVPPPHCPKPERKTT